MRNFLKNILPPPVRTFMREVKNVLDSVWRVEADLSAKLDKISGENDALREQLNEQGKALKQLQEVLGNFTGTDSSSKTYDAARDARDQALQAKRQASEAVWGEIFNNVTADSSWLKNRSFSPGRWALGYPALYVLYRVLNEFQPQSILELGLGQSTHMTAQYTAAHTDVSHYVVEHDQAWIDVFLKSFSLPQQTQIVRLNLEMAPYKEAESVRSYAGFADSFSGKHFDLILIDGPLGGDMKIYSRVDVLRLLPGILSDRFVIMLDDYNRPQEQNTGHEMEKILTEHSIAYAYGNYSGDKDMRVWCSLDALFLISM